MEFFNDAIKDSMDMTNVIRIEIRKITGKRKKFDKEGKEMKWGRME